MPIYQMVLTMLFVVNPFGCVPIFVSIVKDFEPKRQRLILFRESIFGGILALILLWAGKGFLQSIHIEDYAVNLSGGILIFLVAIGMIFPDPMFDVALALVITWLIVIPVSVSAAYLQKLLGKRGLLVLEQLMGMMLTMLSIQIILGGINKFLDQDYLTFANFLISG